MLPLTTVFAPALVMAVKERAPKESAFPRSTVGCAATALPASPVIESAKPASESVVRIASESTPMDLAAERERAAPASCVESFIVDPFLA